MKKLLSLGEVVEKINGGEKLVLAADERLLSELPKGDWIAGTIPYFMGDDGGVFSKELIYVDELPDFATGFSIKTYTEETLPGIAANNFENGYTILIVPAFSKLHVSFAADGNHYDDIFLSPLAGWVAGIDLSETGTRTPKVFNGQTGTSSDADAVAIHIGLPEGKAALLDIINLFEQGDGDTLTFAETGFDVTECAVNGETRNLADYLAEKSVDLKLPLVANYCGAMINTSFNKVDNEAKTVSLYAPVFKNVEYRIARPIDDYVTEFSNKLSTMEIEPEFSCNCILNYLYSELEGKQTAHITGPVTFGEIAYQLLNQTMVYVDIKDV